MITVVGMLGGDPGGGGGPVEEVVTHQAGARVRLGVAGEQRPVEGVRDHRAEVLGNRVAGDDHALVVRRCDGLP